MDPDAKPWELAERALNDASARSAARYERMLELFRPKVLRADADDRSVAFYEAAIVHSMVLQMSELQDTDVVTRARQIGVLESEGTSPTVPRAKIAADLVAIAGEGCVRPDAARENVELFERLVAILRFRDFTDRAMLDMIDAAKACDPRSR